MKRAQLHLPAGVSARASDALALALGSWPFVVLQSILIVGWITLNTTTHLRPDPMPFVLLNLIFSVQAAYASPIILMSQNRQAERDRCRDDIEAQEVDELHTINKRQLEILEVLLERREERA